MLQLDYKTTTTYIIEALILYAFVVCFCACGLPSRPLILTPEQQGKVKQDPKEETPS